MTSEKSTTIKKDTCATGPKGCGNKPNCVSSVDTRKSHQVDAFELSEPLELAWRKIKELIASQTGSTVKNESKNYLKAEFKSRFFGFIDDLELHVSDDQSRIEVRSASRVGYSDMGVNRKRVEAIRNELKRLGVVK